MNHYKISRRKAITTASIGALGAFTNFPFTSINIENSKKLALHGGEKIRTSS